MWLILTIDLFSSEACLADRTAASTTMAFVISFTISTASSEIFVFESVYFNFSVPLIESYKIPRNQNNGANETILLGFNCQKLNLILI